MKLSLFAVSAALIGFAAAQTQLQLPTCANSCVTNLLPASCNSNPECICKDSNFISNISCCIFRSCPDADQTAALGFAKTICTPVGVTLPAQAGCSGSSTSSGSAASSVTSSASAASSSAASASSSAAAAATSTRNAGEKFAAQGISLVGAVVGAVALL